MKYFSFNFHVMFHPCKMFGHTVKSLLYTFLVLQSTTVFALVCFSTPTLLRTHEISFKCNKRGSEHLLLQGMRLDAVPLFPDISHWSALVSIRGRGEKCLPSSSFCFVSWPPASGPVRLASAHLYWRNGGHKIV